LKALVCIYDPVDLFLPTLNAVKVLAEEFEAYSDFREHLNFEAHFKPAAITSSLSVPAS
jgi:hypothetical protein